MPAFNPYQVAGTNIFGPSNYNDYPLAGTQIFGPLEKQPPVPTPNYGPFRGYNFGGAAPITPSTPATPTVPAPTIPGGYSAETVPTTPAYNLPNVTPGTVTMPKVGGPEEVAKAVSVADIINKYNQNNLTGQYEAFNPNLRQNLASSSANTSSLLAGQIPSDVVNQMAQLNAERTGARGIDVSSPAANAALMRLYGITSLDLQRQGEQNLTGAIARTPVAQPFEISTQLTTPAQALDANLRVQMANLQAKTGLQEAQIRAAVDFANQATQMGIAKLDSLSAEKRAELQAQTQLTDTQLRIAADIQNAQLQARVQESGQRNNWNIALMEQEMGMNRAQLQAALQWQGDLLQAGTMQMGQQEATRRAEIENQTAMAQLAAKYGYGGYGGGDIPPFPGYGG